MTVSRLAVLTPANTLNPRPSPRSGPLRRSPGPASAPAVGAPLTGTPPSRASTTARATAQELTDQWTDTQVHFNSRGDGQASHPAWVPVADRLPQTSGPIQFWRALAPPRASVERFGAPARDTAQDPLAGGQLFLHFLDPDRDEILARLGPPAGELTATATASIRSVAAEAPARTEVSSPTPSVNGDREPGELRPLPQGGVLKFSAPWVAASKDIPRDELVTLAGFNAFLARHGDTVAAMLMPDERATRVTVGELNKVTIFRPMPPEVQVGGDHQRAFLSGVVVVDPRFWASEHPAAQALRQLFGTNDARALACELAKQLAPQFATLFVDALAHGWIPNYAHLQNINILFSAAPDGRATATVKYQDFYDYLRDDLLLCTWRPLGDVDPDVMPVGERRAESLAGRDALKRASIARAIDVGFGRWVNALSQLAHTDVAGTFRHAFIEAMSQYCEASGLSPSVAALAACEPPGPRPLGGSALGGLCSRFRDALVTEGLRRQVADGTLEACFSPGPLDFGHMPPQRPTYTGQRFDRIVALLTDPANRERIVSTAPCSLTAHPNNTLLQEDSPALRSQLSSCEIRLSDRLLVLGAADSREILAIPLTAREVRRLRGSPAAPDEATGEGPSASTSSSRLS